MKWTAEADLVVGVTVGSGKRKLGFGFRIGRKKVVKRIGIDLEEEILRRYCFFCLKDSAVSSWNWSSMTTNSIFVDRDRAMKRSNAINLFLQMMPASVPSTSASPDHWAFLVEVDAPQWADLVKEAALMGKQRDDPWFHRSHSHHETSLARTENVDFAGKESSIEKPEQPTKRKVGQVKGTVSKLIKPSLKATVVKACLGSMQRISNVGMKEGRLSSRPRMTSQPRPRTPKRVHIQRTGLLKKAAPPGSDPRLAAFEAVSNVVTRKKSSTGKIGNIPRIDPSINAHDRPKIDSPGIGRSILSIDQSVDRPPVVSQSTDSSASIYESPNPSSRLYRLPSPPDGARSSPSDMIFSSDASPATSNSSHDSKFPTLQSSAALVCKRKLLTDDNSGKELHPDASLELRSASHCADIEVNEPSLETSSFKVLDRELLSNGDGEDITASTRTANRRRVSIPRLKRSLGPPLRVKQIEKVGSPSVKKKGSGKLIDHQDGGLPTKLVGAQATHPILEKLRKSWGSALRVKQRQDAEVAVADARSDNGSQKSGAADQTAGRVLHSDNNGNLRGRKVDNVQMQSEVVRRGQPGGAATQSSEGQVHLKDAITRQRQYILQHSAKEVQVSHTSRRIESIVPASRILCKSRSMGTADTKMCAPLAAKTGLARIQPNHQRSKSEINSKFKKQYAHPETGINKSLSMRANKENMHSEMRAKAQTSPPGLERKKKTQNLVSRSIIATSARQLGPAGGIPPASLSVNVIRNSPQAAQSIAQTRTSPQARNVAINKAGPTCRLTRTIGHEATDSSGQKSAPLDKKLNVGVLPGSTSSLPKLTKQTSDKTSSTFVKEATANPGAKGCKKGVKVADESTAITAEDRKSKAAPKYEPRLHSVKAIKEWESKSGRRYYDLQPSERQKANQQITAASKTVTKRSTA